MIRHLPIACLLSAVSLASSGTAMAKDKSSGGIASSLLGDLFVKKERSVLEIHAGMAMFRERDSWPDPSLNLDLDLALSPYFHLEGGAGGYHEHIPHWLWNGFFSYIIVGIAYGFTSLAGLDDSFDSLRDPLVIPMKKRTHPYTNLNFNTGAHLVPFPMLRLQPFAGISVVSLAAKNKGSALRKTHSFRTLGVVGLESRSEQETWGMEVMLGPQGQQVFVEGVKAYFSHPLGN